MSMYTTPSQNHSCHFYCTIRVYIKGSDTLNSLLVQEEKRNPQQNNTKLVASKSVQYPTKTSNPFRSLTPKVCHDQVCVLFPIMPLIDQILGENYIFIFINF